MSKKVFTWRSQLCIVHYALCILLLSGLSMSVTSCSDDDDDKKSEEQKQQEAQQQADIFWDVVGQLVSTDDYTADYKDKTFEPTIGQPSDDNQYVRVVATNDMETAAQRFAQLVGLEGFSATTQSYTWKNDAVGTLTWRKTSDGSSWGIVDVDIKQVPHLQQIVYLAPSQMGTNASFDGTAYYRFGDVVQRINDGQEEYWVCVRPAFGKEGKSDSHWMTFSPLPKKNIWDYTASTKTVYALPTGIGKHTEHMQNMAEMLYAILHPTEWFQNINQNPKLKMFNDFDHDNIDYHNDAFWERVCDAWTKKDVWKVLFGEDFDTADKVKQSIDANGLNMLYKGYSWWTWTSWDLTLYEANYTSTDKSTELNMHKATLSEVSGNVKDIKDLNIRARYQDSKLSFQSSFFGPGPRFIVRYATGKELCGTKPSVYTSIVSQTNHLKDFYNYNDVYNIKAGQGVEPEIARSKNRAKLGDFIGSDGLCYSSLADVQKANATPVAVVLYYTDGDNLVEWVKGIDEPDVELDKTVPHYRGLAMALEDLPACAWSTDEGYENGYSEGCATLCTDIEDGLLAENDCETDMKGIKWTNWQAGQGCQFSHVHPAALACYNKTTISKENRRKRGLSDWFLPSFGQWQSAINWWAPFAKGEFDEPRDGEFYKIMKNAFVQWGIGDKMPNGNYWVNTHQSKAAAYVLSIKENEHMQFFTDDKHNNTHKVRAFIALE